MKKNKFNNLHTCLNIKCDNIITVNKNHLYKYCSYKCYCEYNNIEYKLPRKVIRG